MEFEYTKRYTVFDEPLNLTDLKTDNFYATNSIGIAGTSSSYELYVQGDTRITGILSAANVVIDYVDAKTANIGIATIGTATIGTAGITTATIGTAGITTATIGTAGITTISVGILTARAIGIGTTDISLASYSSRISVGDTQSKFSLVEGNLRLVSTGNQNGNYTVGPYVTVIGIGSTVSSSYLDGGDTYPGYNTQNYSNLDYSAGEYNFYKAGLTQTGTVGIATTCNSDTDIIGYIHSRAYSGTRFENAAGITFQLNSRNITGSGNHPSSDIIFWGRGSTNAGQYDQANRVRIRGATGGVYIAAIGIDTGIHIRQIGAGNAFRVDDTSNDTTPFVILGNGLTGVGLTNPAYRLHVNGGIGATTVTVTSTLSVTGNSSGGTLQASNLGLVGGLNGPVYSTSTGTLTNTSSDKRLKENISKLTYGLDTVSDLNPVSFNWINKEERGSQREIGLLAQEVQDFIPEIVGLTLDETLFIDYSKLTPVLVKAIQELSQKVEDLTTELNSLKNSVNPDTK